MPEIRVEAMKLLPEFLRRDVQKEAAAWLTDQRGSGAQPLDDAGLERLMTGHQGTLLYCRCLPTALEMRRRFPEAEFCLEEAGDARACHTVLLYGGAERVTAPFRSIVFCDGDAGFQREGTACFRLTPTAAFSALRESVGLDKDALRACYVLLRGASFRNLEEFAAAVGISTGQAVFALSVLDELALIRFSLSPFGVTLLPVRKVGPEQSALYHLVMDTAGRGEHGVFGV